MRTELLPLVPATYRPHPLHAACRVWTETNCYVDLWIEVLHGLGLDPVAAGAVALASDFEGDQWTFLKYAPEDLRSLYGIEVAEMQVWRPLAEHVEEHLARGRLLTVEVDAWHLPDTAGVSYRLEHVKTAVVPQMIDPGQELLGYFHNAGYHELGGEDYRGVLGSGEPARLPPYVELVRLGGRALAGAELVSAARALAAAYLARRPATNPVTRFATRLGKDLAWLSGGGLDRFHRYAFATCRQCGAAAEIAAAFVEWLDRETAGGGPTEAVAALGELAAVAKTLQFVLARAAAGRAASFDGLLERMATCWESAMGSLEARYGCGAA